MKTSRNYIRKIIRRPYLWLVVLVLPVMLLSCGKGHRDAAEVADIRPTVAVTVATAAGDANGSSFTASGRIEAQKSVQVSSRMMGALTGVYVKEGDRVRTGEVLATIDNTDTKARIAQAEAGVAEARAALANAEKDQQRIKVLFDRKSATQKELDDITTHRDMLAASVEQAVKAREALEVMLSYSVVTAPFSGVITGKLVSSGDLASPGRPLFTLETTSGFQAAAMIPETYVRQIDRNEQVTVVVKSSGQAIQGTITEFGGSAVNTGGQYPVRIDLDPAGTADGKIYSGMYVNVIIPLTGGHIHQDAALPGGGILVPESAIVHQGQLTGIFTVSQEQTAILRWVRLGGKVGGNVEVLSGLEAGEEYIASAAGRLLNGVNVEVQ